MEERDWEKFFELIEKIVNMPGTVDKKQGEVTKQSKSDPDRRMYFEEFMSWDFDIDGDDSDEEEDDDE